MPQKNTSTQEQRNDALERFVDIALSAGPVSLQTDKYFAHTRKIVKAHGDKTVTYAVFLRQRAIAALMPMVKFLSRLAPKAKIHRFYKEGDIVPAGSKMIEITGSLVELSELETLILQKIGFTCICAVNAYEMCLSLPQAAFIDMHARHAPGAEVNFLAAYGATVGSDAARLSNTRTRGFIGSSQDLTAPLFGAKQGMGTMPHSLIGYTGGNVLKAIQLFEKQLPDQLSLTALVDYEGNEVTDALKCAKWFYEEAELHKKGKTFSVRLDTHGGRFAEGLDFNKSIDILEKHFGIKGEYNIVERVLGTQTLRLDSDNVLTDNVRRILFGSGVSLASIVNMRHILDKANFSQAQIVVSSGFNSRKCQVMGAGHAPIDVVGTGSFIPATFGETFATADIISYDGEKRVKLGREFLFEANA